jgi:hypothetical protein
MPKCTRAEAGRLLKASKAVAGGVSLRATAKGSQYGQDMATVRRRRQRSGGAVGASRPVRTLHVARGERAGRSVGVRGSHGAWTDGPRPASACGPSRTAGRRRASWSAEL